MNLRIQYTAQLRTAAGKSEDQIDLPASSTLATLCTHLATRLHDSAAAHLLNSTGQPHQSLLILLNNSLVPSQNVPTTILHPNDTITFLPPIAGG
jgi:sulfur-carrier protein